jgi:hypothetical protein
MRDTVLGLLIGFGIFLAFMLILIEVQLHAILGLLRQVRDRFVSANHSDNDGV